MTELLESTGGIVAFVAAVGLVGLFAYWAFGSQAVGLPAMIGAFALWGLISLVSDAGFGAIGVVVVVGGVAAVLLVIGMAMKIGADPSIRSDAERAGEDSS